jgi:hypothetical protein
MPVHRSKTASSANFGTTILNPETNCLRRDHRGIWVAKQRRVYLFRYPNEKAEGALASFEVESAQAPHRQLP